MTAEREFNPGDRVIDSDGDIGTVVGYKRDGSLVFELDAGGVFDWHPSSVAEGVVKPYIDPSTSDGRKVIVRGDRSGVFYGTHVSEHGQTVELADARHIWYWAGAANTAEIANSGVSRPDECKIVAPVTRLRVLDAIEVIDCTPAAVTSLDAVPEWSER